MPTRSADGAGGRVGVAVVGLGGAVASTVAAGVELLRLGVADHTGLPQADRTDLVPYEDIVVGGWDLDGADLAKAAALPGVLEPAQLEPVSAQLRRTVPWPAVADPRWCRNAVGVHAVEIASLRGRIDHVRDDLRRFREEHRLDTVVVVNLASTEARSGGDLLASEDAFERALDADDDAVTPGMLHAYAAVTEGCPYVDFTPGAGAESPALQRLAERHGVPVAGKDGKTGQTLLKSVLAPALRSRGLHVDGWYSTNLLGNRDGEILDGLLGYEVDDHVVRIDYYRPRGDATESWDNVDVTGFLGRPMQIKVDFLCRDSVLAAPLVLELARLLAEAARRGVSGAQEQFGYFFKAPVTRDGGVPEHALYRQERRLAEWLDGR